MSNGFFDILFLRLTSAVSRAGVAAARRCFFGHAAHVGCAGCWRLKVELRFSLSASTLLHEYADFGSTDPNLRIVRARRVCREASAISGAAPGGS